MYVCSYISFVQSTSKQFQNREKILWSKSRLLLVHVVVIILSLHSYAHWHNNCNYFRCVWTWTYIGICVGLLVKHVDDGQTQQGFVNCIMKFSIFNSHFEVLLLFCLVLIWFQSNAHCWLVSSLFGVCTKQWVELEQILDC